MQNREAKGKIKYIISKPKIAKKDFAELVDVVLQTKTVIKLKSRMKILIRQGIKLTNKLPKEESRSKFRTILSFMLEDL